MFNLSPQTKKIINIVLTVLMSITATLFAILSVFDIISWNVSGIVIPLCLATLMLLNIFELRGKKDSKPIMIFYIISLSACLIILFFDIVYMSI